MPSEVHGFQCMGQEMGCDPQQEASQEMCPHPKQTMPDEDNVNKRKRVLLLCVPELVALIVSLSK